jgi:plasmid replication initiation protein
VTVRADEFAEVFGIESRGHVYESLQDAASRLGERWIRNIKRGPHGTYQQNVRWVWLIEYRKGEGTVVLGFSPGVAPYLTLLHERFTRYKLKQIGAIGTMHGLRLYELMAQYRVAGDRTIKLDRLREILDLDGKYTDIKNLRVRVLDPAIAEINRHTDLRVKMTPERKGRKVVGFHFAIGQNAQIPLDLPAAAAMPEASVVQMVDAVPAAGTDVA